MNLLPIFLTGLSIGGFSCLAVQGGLLASQISDKKSFLPTVSFLISKLVAYTLLGLFLGAFGQVLNLSPQLQSVLQLLAGVYMILVALNLLELHPIFRYVILQPPRFLTRLIHRQSHSSALFAPVFLGAMTVFIPCGTTLAMEALAVSSSSAFWGAAIMFTFILGTVPVFSGIGFLTTLLNNAYKTVFTKVAALMIIFLGLLSLKSSLTTFGLFSPSPPAASQVSLSRNITINITSSGYSPNYFTVKAGVPLTLTLTNTGSYSCASAFRLPAYGISANLPPGQSRTFEFTPSRPGKIPFSCSMGMYSGVIDVI